MRRFLTRPRFILICVVIVVWGALNYTSTDYYSIEQGSATPLAPNLTVTGLPSDPPETGLVAKRPGFFLVDVRLEQMSLGRWLRARLVGGIDYLPISSLVPAGTTVTDFDRSGYIDMEDAKQTASYVAFKAMGLAVKKSPDGAVVVARRTGSPAAKAKIRVGDRIIGVNGVATPTQCDVVRELHEIAPRTAISVRVEPAKISSSGVVVMQPPVTMSVTTAPPKRTWASDCPGVVGKARSLIGVSLGSATKYTLPAQVTIDTNYVGGPSGGLAMTLAIYDRVTTGRLTGRHRVAVTGTIAPDGRVGEIGGVAQKARAAVTAHADIFLVPSSQAGEARSAIHGELRVVGVSTFDEALRALRRLGGDRPVLRGNQK